MSRSDNTYVPFSASKYVHDERIHILVASTGSVATIKLPLIVKAFSGLNDVSIRIVVSASASEFLQGQSAEQPHLSALLDYPNVEGIHKDEDEWKKPWIRGDKILHIELRRWAHVMLIAPLSANSLAKIVNGISDNLITSVVRAWDTTGMVDVRKKLIFVALAMNTAMWHHPVTARQIAVLESDWGYHGSDLKGDPSQDVKLREDGCFKVLRPTEKELACGDTGDGAMMDWRDVVSAVATQLEFSTHEIKQVLQG